MVIIVIFNILAKAVYIYILFSRTVGVVTYIMLTGHFPFAGDSKQETFLNISQLNLDFPDNLFENVSQEAQDFITQLCVLDPR